MKHILSSVILEQKPVLDCNIINWLDTSLYSENLDIENPILRIHPPNWRDYKSITYSPKQINIIRPKSLGFSYLEDGVYKFIQSVKPNSKVSFEFCYLKICNKKKCLLDILCEEDCTDTSKLAEITDLLLQLDIAQELVSNCDIKKGIELFNIVSKNIENLKKDCNFCE